MRRLLSGVFLSCAIIAPVAIAQQTDAIVQQPSLNAVQSGESEIIFFGDANQPGRGIHMAIAELVNSGVSLDEAVNQTITDITSEEGGSLSAIVGLNQDISASFMRNMVSFNKLTDGTKSAIEEFPGNAADVVQLAVKLYPSFAQDVIDAAIISGEIEPNEALIAAISAGADPTTVSSATAAGAAVAVAAAPAGAGVGAGGAGGGDTTASTN
jgi:hypothetical protein